MVRVPLPQQPEQTGASPGFSAPGVAAPPLDYGGVQMARLGEALTTAGLDVAKQGFAAEQRLHATVVKEAQALADERILEADRAYTSLLGRNATGEARKRAWDDLQEQIGNIDSGLGHDIQRRLFRQVVGRGLLVTNDRWQRHELEQLRVREEGARAAVIQGKRERAALQRLDGALGKIPEPGSQEPPTIGSPERGVQEPERQPNGEPTRQAIPDLLESLRSEVRSGARAHGLAAEETAALVRQETTQVHAWVVDQLIDKGRVTEARKYLEKLPDSEIDLGTRTDLQKLVRRGAVKEEAIDVANRIRDELYGERRAAIPLRTTAEMEPLEPGTAIAEAETQVPAEELSAAELGVMGRQRIRAMHEKGEITPEVRDAAWAEIDTMAGEMHTQRLATEEHWRQQGEQWFMDPAHRGKSVSQLPANIYTQGARLGLLDDWSRFVANDNNYPNDEQFFYELFLPGSEHLALPAEDFVTMARTRLDRQHFRIAMAMYGRAHEAPYDPKIVSDTDIVQAMGYEAGYLTPGRPFRKADDALKWFRFQLAAQRVLSTMDGKTDEEKIAKLRERLVRDKQGGDVIAQTQTPEEMYGISESEAAALFQRGEQAPRGGTYVTRRTMRDWWLATRPTDPVPSVIKEMDTLYLIDIPREERERIESALVMSNEYPSTNMVIYMWLRAKERESARDTRR